ncbi:hypothetical protein MASR2M50_35930 [Thauera sp.]
MQGDRLGEHRVELAVEALEQLAAGREQGQERLAQRRVGLARGGGCEQALGMGGRVGELLALFVDLELVQADVGDLDGEPGIGNRRGQRPALLEQDAREQDAALQHADLLVDHRSAAVQCVELLACRLVAPGEPVELLGGAQQVFGQLLVGRRLASEQTVAAGVGVHVGERLHGLLGLAGALPADRILQRACRFLEARDLQAGEFLAGETEVDQAAVARQLLAAQRELGVERMPFGGERVATLRTQGPAVAPGFASAREHGLDRRHARLAGADLGLRTLGAGARADEQAIGLVEAAAPVGERGLLGGEAFFEASERGVGRGRHGRRVRGQRGELAARLGDLRRSARERLLERIEPATVVLGAGEAGLGLFQRLLRGALLGLGQLALRQRLQARAQFVRLRPRRRLGGGVHGEQGEQQQEEQAQQGHGTTTGGGAARW